MTFKINKVVVLGAGVMGSSIAAHIVGAGIPVRLLDIRPNKLTEDEEKKGQTLDSYEVRNRFSIAGKKRILNPKTNSIYDTKLGHMIEVGNFEDDLEKISDSDWIIEVIVENLNIKKSMFKDIEKYKKEGSIVSSNTSGISINDMVEDMSVEFRKNFLGTHFFNPPRYMKLLELIPNSDTDKKVLDFMEEFGTRILGKGVVIAQDTPSFIANRIGAYSSINIVNLALEYGFDIPKVDQLTGDLIGRPKSATYRTLDMVGLDVFNFVAEGTIDNITDENEKLELKLPTFILELIDKGHLGDKARQGFYKRVKTEKGRSTLVWDKDKKEYVEFEKPIIDAVTEAKRSDNKLRTMVYGDSKENKFVWEIMRNILLYSAEKATEITDDYRKIDDAMRWGYNWNLGPFQLWDEIGLEKSVDLMKEEGIEIPQWIEERIVDGKTKFYDQAESHKDFIQLNSDENKVIFEKEDGKLIDLGDGVVCFKITSKGNSITDGVLEALSESLKIAKKDYKGLVIGNEGGNFSVGANLDDIGRLAKNEAWDELYDLVEKFQVANQNLKYADIPVVAAPYARALGGGAELALHATRIVAHAELYMGLVEVGVGLVPGGGGSKELLFRAMEDMERTTLLERTNKVTELWKKIAMAKVSSSGHDAKRNGFMSLKDRIVMNEDYLIDEAKKEVLRIYEEGFKPKLEKNILAIGATGKASIDYMIESMVQGKFISEYDAYLAKKVAYILSGGDVLPDTPIDENYVLKLEREVFVDLCKENKTQDRIEHMLKSGRPLRN